MSTLMLQNPKQSQKGTLKDTSNTQEQVFKLILRFLAPQSNMCTTYFLLK